MTEKLQALLQAGGLTAEPFPATSRYHAIPVATYHREAQPAISYLRRRMIPPPERFSLLQEHLVVQGDRPDTLAGHYLGDTEQYWRIADANNVLRPNDLTERPGTSLRITLPEGIGGQADA